MSSHEITAAAGRPEPAVAHGPTMHPQANGGAPSNAAAGDVPADGGSPKAAPLPGIVIDAARTAFPIEALGPGLAAAARAIQARTLAPLALCGQAVLAAAALATQAHADVVLPNDQRRPLSLALLSVASPGERLDAVEDLAFAAVHAEERRLSAAAAASRAAAAADRRPARARQRGERDRRQPAAAAAASRPRCLLTSDPTPRHLFRLLERNGPSLGVADAGDGAVLAAGRRGERRRRLMTRLARLWRDGSIERDHDGDGAATLHGRRLSLHLAVTPDDSLAELAAPDRAALTRRLLPVAPLSTKGTRFIDDAGLARIAATRPALGRFERRITGLLRAAPAALTPRPLPLSAAARRRWRGFANVVEATLAEDGDFADIDALAGTAAEQVARIAGVLSLYADGDTAAIGAAALDGAVALMRHYLGEARHLAGLPRALAEARLNRAVLDYMVESDRPEVHLTEIYRSGPRLLRDPGAVRAALRRLEAEGQVAAIPGGAWLDGRDRREVWQLLPDPHAPAPAASDAATTAPAPAALASAAMVPASAAEAATAAAPGSGEAARDAQGDAARDVAKVAQMPVASASATPAPSPADASGVAQTAQTPAASTPIAARAVDGGDAAGVVKTAQTPAERRERRLVAKGVPRDWIEGVARLATMAPPPAFTASRWVVFVTICEQLLEEHGAALHRAGWTAAEVFGGHPHAPWRALEIAGLALFLLTTPGAFITEIRRDGVIYDKPENRQTPYGPYWHTKPPRSGVAPWLITPAPARLAS
jgi:hypothetical protein